MTTTTWTRSYADVTHFMGILWHADILTSSDTDITDIVEYLDHPNLFTREHEIWEECGQPEPEEDEAAWAEFVEAISVVQMEVAEEEEEE